MTRLPLPVFLTLFAPQAFAAVPATVLTSLESSAVVRAVSGDGSTVCGDYNSGAFVWTAENGRSFLNPPSGSTQWRANGVSDNGTMIVGNAGNAPGLQAIRWDSGSPVELGWLDGKPYPGAIPQSSANDISADGSVIVGYSTSATNLQEAFRLENGNMTGLGALPGGSGFSIAHAVSADGGTVVGQASSASGNEAFIRRNGEVMGGLGDFAGGNYFSVARAVSGDGSVVVGSGSVNRGGSSVPAAFRWVPATGMTALPLPEGSSQSEALGISAAGNLITGTATIAALPHAVIWDDQAGVLMLEDLLEAKGVDLTGWYLFSAAAISDDGDTIAGNGWYDGDEVGWVITGALDLFIPDVPLPLVEITRGESAVTLGFETEPGYLYQAEVSSDLIDGSWENLGSAHSTAGAGTAGEHQVIDPDPAAGQSFYRVRVEPAP